MEKSSKETKVSCCEQKPMMLCRVCDNCACIKHSLQYKRNHPPADQLTSTGRETFWCGDTIVTYIRKCKDESQIISSQKALNLWKGRYAKDGSGVYRKKALAYYGAKCVDCGFDKEAILVVHHKDGNRKNNSMKNLEVVCPTHHAVRHLDGDKVNYRK